MRRWNEVETVVIGGGQAGLATSSCLRDRGREHVVLERGRVGERWKTERWDSFALQGPNWTLELPGRSYDGADPDGFATRAELIDWLDDYALRIAAPLQCGTTVESLRQDPSADRWLVRTDHGGFRAANVVVATGAFERPYVPDLATLLPPSIVQVAAVRYQNPTRLPDGGVLVVGGGSSACQIATDLLRAGRSVHLSVGLHDRVPRRYRGRDVIAWLTDLGEFDRTTKTQVVGKAPSRRGTGPGLLLTGVDGGYTVDVRHLVMDGARLLGHLTGVDGHRLTFAPDADRVLEHGDVMFRRFVKAVDLHVVLNGLEAPHEEVEIVPSAYRPADPVESLDLRAAGISSVVWATGLQREYPWLEVPVLDEERVPVHERGVTAFPGLFFVGLTWQSRLLSPFINGVGRDADHVAEQVVHRMASVAATSR